MLYFSPLQAQNPLRKQLTGIWIGVHTEWSTDAVCPLPTYLQLDADSTYHLGMVDGWAMRISSTWSTTDKFVRLDTIHYAPNLVQINGNLLRIGTLSPMVFRRFTSIAVDSATAYEQLRGRVWQSDSLIVSLYANGKASLENSVTKQRTTHFWKLARFGASVFLVIRGNQFSRDGNYKPLWQISSLSTKQLQAIGWNGHVVATEMFQLARNLSLSDSCQSSGFQTCDNCFARMWYSTSLTNSEERYALNRLLGRHYQAVPKPGQSGLIRIEFVVNCAGERGLFQLAGFDDDYQCKDFDPQITQQLLAICREHIRTDFSSFISDQSGHTPHDSAVSLTFRLKDGRLIDILP